MSANSLKAAAASESGWLNVPEGQAKIEKDEVVIVFLQALQGGLAIAGGGSDDVAQCFQAGSHRFLNVFVVVDEEQFEVLPVVQFGIGHGSP